MAEAINTSTESFVGAERMRYELPMGGISITGYIVRRLQKTALLTSLASLEKDLPAQALATFGVYALASATSWGPAFYQPSMGRPGAEISEADPATGAKVTVRYLERDPHFSFSYEVTLPSGGVISGQESITGTMLTIGGLGMPAPSIYAYRSGDGSYTARATGVINSELAPRLFAPTQIRGFGALQLSDSAEHTGSIKIDRRARISAEILRADKTVYAMETELR
ncbi:MAG: hypothetical protein GYB68_08660 [Chloroflexi bacterium]|nr:hypothetical protein [Chloroflexota bacterium]